MAEIPAGKGSEVGYLEQAKKPVPVVPPAPAPKPAPAKEK